MRPPESKDAPDYWVSPHFPSSAFTGPLTDEQKIELFADSVRGWQLDVAERLIASDPHSGLAVLSIVLSYFEMMAKYRDGYAAKGKSKEYFSKGSDG